MERKMQNVNGNAATELLSETGLLIAGKPGD